MTRHQIGRRSSMAALLALMGFVLAGSPAGQTPAVREHKDLVYATVDGKSLALDLYMPAGVQSPGLVVWVHGGAWRSGSKREVPIAGLTARGYGIASVDYRLSPMAKFPAQVHDIKAAIRTWRPDPYRT